MQQQSDTTNRTQPPAKADGRFTYAAAAVVFLFATVIVYLTVAVRFAVNSDNMYFLLAAEDFLHGNFTLQGWRGGYFSALSGDIALAALFRALAGRRAALYIIGPISCGVIAAFGFLLICRRVASRRLSLLLTAPLVFFPRAIWHPMSTLGMHAVSIAQIVFLIYASDQLASTADIPSDKKNRPRTILRWFGFTFAVTLGCIADGFVLYFFAAPLFAVALFDFAITRRKMNVFFALSVALSAGLSKGFLAFLEKRNGLKLAQSTTRIISFSEFWRYLTNALDTWTRMFSPTPEKPFAAQAFFAQAASVLLAGSIFALITFRFILLIRKWKDSAFVDKLLLASAAFVDKLLLASAAFVVGSFAFTNVTLGEPAFRYLAPACFFALIIAARTIGTFTKSLFRFFGVALLCAIALLNVSFSARLRPVSDLRLVEIADALKDRGVTRVYGTYWESLALNYYSGGTIEAAPVIGVADMVLPFEWSSKEDWYHPSFGASCLLVEENQRNGLSPALISDFFGAEDELLMYHQVEIRCYDRNLSELFSTQK